MVRSARLDAGPAANDGAAPQAGALVLRREALQRLQQHRELRLIVVQAPAGFGKTSLLQQYCELRAAQGDAVAWLRVDLHCADASQFLRALCEALRGGAAPRGRGARRPSTLEDLASLLRAQSGRLLLVIDNFEQASGAALDGLLGQLVRLLKPGMQLCLGTRVLPGHRLSRLLIEEQSLLLDAEALRFSAAESTEFLRDSAMLSAREITELHERCDGWPAALQCLRLCLRRGRSQRSLAFAGRGITPELIDFLAAEVFEQLAPELQSLLLELCVPEKLSAALVEHISARGQGREQLARIEKAGLFLAQADLQRHWYRFHNLFRHFLLARLRSETSDQEMQARHGRIAQWYEQHGFREEAIQHYLDAQRQDEAARLLSQIIDSLIAEERLGLVERYVEQLPVDSLLASEALCEAAIIAYGFRRSFDKAHRLIERRAAHLQTQHADAHTLARHHSTRLFVLAAQDRIEEMGQCAGHCLQHLDARDGYRYAVSLNARSMACVGRSDFDQARSLCLQARPLHDRERHLFGQAYQEAIHAMTLSAQGRIVDAQRCLSAALHHTEQEAAGSVSAGSVLAAYLAEACYEQNRITEAEGLIHDYAQLAEQQAIADPLAVMLLTQARIAHLRGDEAEAEEILERLLYLGYRHGYTRLLSYARAEFVRQATLSGDLDRAERRLRELDPEHDATLAGPLLFHAGENEAHGISLARYLIHSGRHAQARTALQAQIREARQQRRRRRELKLSLLLAISLHNEGREAAARRAMLETLSLGTPQEFIRSILDERAPALRLLRELGGGLQQLPELSERDSLQAYLEHLLREAGDKPLPAPACQVARPPSAELLASLTEREKRLLRHVATGLSNRELAERLSVSTNTVKWHLRNIFEKLQIGNRVQAIALARHLGLID
ncbi:LuxR family transcriptional regulator, maltose regulon positive regulatory protein [Solimonas aquatica]|uniref:LuxR family transcriptional regulator, maltose regulon positive regulatory protein n=1 Tax=Solimonas aquatica TaxID=489703 RepID=A0A1H9FJM7_9GAMM|nr:LuxR C-terminal-related transcriptional regulator [Solimonas aquatica]SEQ38112.1 LuxR family transcriptional regulator, maltose regulon positive regulatory protein [Solimonas aquatica]